MTLYDTTHGVIQAWLLAKEFLYPRSLGEMSKARTQFGKLRHLPCVAFSRHNALVDADQRRVKAAFGILSDCRMLPALLDDFIGEPRRDLDQCRIPMISFQRICAGSYILLQKI